MFGKLISQRFDIYLDSLIAAIKSKASRPYRPLSTLICLINSEEKEQGNHTDAWEITHIPELSIF